MLKPMASKSITSFLFQECGSSLVELPPAFLAPALYSPNVAPKYQRSQFSTSSSLAARYRSRDRSRFRGVSAIHRTGPRKPLPVSKLPLPKPASPEHQEKRPVNPDHGLWGFFGPNKQAIPTPEEEYAHGRAWTIQELRQKSWDDLHCLWWVTVRERNRIATSKYERKRLAAGYGDFEADNRDNIVRATQHAIKHVLRERWYAWSEARELYNTGYRPSQEELLEEVAEDAVPTETRPEELDPISKPGASMPKDI
ncbi:54S ribosomal protein L4 mitochondrial [Emydomyces testavorans]|uniref:Large ribosomal subunit protein uL29m n=1 Tax=Emydomyces testavorans TaxID=2070801 RepID=A0AAF0DJ72_9EURO|nr:54S ribosomal protein L4 mitochondrial [Emydomyces testavorans]